MRITVKPTLLLILAALGGDAAAENLVAIRVSDYNLISFDSATPGTLTASTATSGFGTGVVPIALDYRVEIDTLYVIGRLPSGTQCQLYTLAGDGSAEATGDVFACAAANQGEMDFDPVGSSNPIRVMSGTNNYRISTAGTITTDTAAAFAGGDANVGDTPDIGGVAYSDNTADATDTTTFALELGNDVLVRVGTAGTGDTTAGTGVLTTIGTGLGVALSADAGFDISGEAPNTAYLSVYDGTASRTRLYTVNLTAGTAALVGDVGNTDLQLVGITVAPETLNDDGDDEDDGGEPLGGAPAGALLAMLGVAALRRRARAGR